MCTLIYLCKLHKVSKGLSTDVNECWPCEWADGKTTTKVNIQPGLLVPREQSENIEQFRVNEVSPQIFQLVENS